MNISQNILAYGIVAQSAQKGKGFLSISIYCLKNGFDYPEDFKKKLNGFRHMSKSQALLIEFEQICA